MKTRTRNVVFVVGAGFSLAANARAPLHPSMATPYPLVSDLAGACFPGARLRAGIEEAFDEALKRRDLDPVRKLVHLIQTADACFGAAEADTVESPYKTLLDTFPDAQFISFNYDALLELLLFKRGMWFPWDGFGVPAEIGPGQEEASGSSKTLVVHLHGTTLLYPVTFDVRREPGEKFGMMHHYDEPKFAFDPDALGNLFVPFQRVSPGFAFKHPELRVIAPVPNKAEALRKTYVKLVYQKAVELIRSASHVVTIGYRFAACDYISFRPLLAAVTAAKTQIVVVAPSAAEIAGRLAASRDRVLAEPIATTFHQWVARGFPGLDHA